MHTACCVNLHVTTQQQPLITEHTLELDVYQCQYFWREFTLEFNKDMIQKLVLSIVERAKNSATIDKSNIYNFLLSVYPLEGILLVFQVLQRNQSLWAFMTRVNVAGSLLSTAANAAACGFKMVDLPKHRFLHLEKNWTGILHSLNLYSWANPKRNFCNIYKAQIHETVVSWVPKAREWSTSVPTHFSSFEFFDLEQSEMSLSKNFSAHFQSLPFGYSSASLVDHGV